MATGVVRYADADQGGKARLRVKLSLRVVAQTSRP